MSLSLPAERNAPILAQHPTVNRTQIVFVYAGDLWSVGREGGEATRLTTGAGAETDPVFSPDGQQIAFTGEYDGNVDVFVMPASGGIPKRLTWHLAADYVLGWTPDGQRILFASTRTSYARLAELFTVGLEGGFEERVPLPVGFEGAYSPDGKSLAYVPVARAFSAWKRYRGGMAAPIWIARLSDGHVEKIPRQNSNDYNLLWIRNKIYFLSDRDGPVSLFCYDTQSKQVRKVLENDGLDLKSAGAGPDAIAYEQFGSLHLYDLKSRKAKPVPIRIAGDLLELREHLVNVSKRLHNAHLSPSGARAVFEAHGEILTLPAEKGDLRNLTNTLGVMERDPIWSPDGKTIAYFSDESGEYALQIRNQSGMGEVVKIPLGDKPGFYLHPVWSPDGKKIAYLDSHLALWYVDLDRKKAVKVDKDRYYPPGYMAPNWSPDSKWLVYSKRLPNYLGTIYLYSVADGKSLQVTDGMSDAQYPVFDKDGKYLYFTASTDSGASLQPDIHSFTRPVSRTIYLTVLAKDLPSPLGPESDEEKAAVADKSAASESPTAEAENETGTRGEEAKPEKANPESGKSAKGAAPVKIDVENISQRILALPLPARRYINLQIGKTGGLYATEAPMPGPGTEPALTVHRFDLSSRKSDVAIGSVRSFEISRNGEKMLYRQGDRWVIAVPRPMAPAGSGAGPLSAAAGPPTGAAGGGPPGAENTLKTDSIEVRVDPKAEWRQMYGETWRIERDFFYDPNLHGLDLNAAEEKYRPYLESVASRRDLTYLFQEMLGEITVSHLGVFGGDTPEVKRIPTGLLGADYKVENGRYRFARVYNGEN